MRPTSLLLGGVAALAAAGGALAAFTALTARRVEAAMPPDGAFLQVEGARLHYVDRPAAGAEPAIVMIHGLAGQTRHFTYALTERLTDLRVVVVDRPGAGWSDAAPGASQAVRAQAAVIAAFIRKLGLERPLVVGHSLGGAVALALALDHPDVVGGLALIAPLTQTVGVVSPVFRALGVSSPLLRRLIGWTLAAPMSIARGPATLAEVFAPEPAPADFATRGGGALGLRPRAFESASADFTAATDDLMNLVGRYPGLKVPVGVLYGDGDRLLDATIHGEGFKAQHPAADLEMVKGAGHMILMTQPDLTAAFVRRVASRLAPQRAAA